jgi:hypothetical protein
MSRVLDWLKGPKSRAAVVMIGGGVWSVATFPIDHHMDQASPSSSIHAEQKGIAIASDQDIRINAPTAINPNATLQRASSRQINAGESAFLFHRYANSPLFGHARTCPYFVTTVLKEVRPT